jgi:hypothetical protein
MYFSFNHSPLRNMHQALKFLKDELFRTSSVHYMFRPAALAIIRRIIVALGQWYSTWGSRGHLKGYVKLKKKYIYYFMINILINS